MCSDNYSSWVILIHKVLLNSEDHFTKTLTCFVQEGHQSLVLPRVLREDIQPYSEDQKCKRGKGLTFFVASQWPVMKGMGRSGICLATTFDPSQTYLQEDKAIYRPMQSENLIMVSSLNHSCNQTFSIKCLQIEKLSGSNFVVLIVPNGKGRLNV